MYIKIDMMSGSTMMVEAEWNGEELYCYWPKSRREINPKLYMYYNACCSAEEAYENEMEDQEINYRESLGD